MKATSGLLCERVGSHFKCKRTDGQKETALRVASRFFEILFEHFGLHKSSDREATLMKIFSIKTSTMGRFRTSQLSRTSERVKHSWLDDFPVDRSK